MLENSEIKPLYKWMQEKGYSVRTLAKAADVGATTINYILNGRNNENYYPRPDVRKKICDVLKVEALVVEEFRAAIEHHMGKETPATRLINRAGASLAVA